MSTSAPLVPPCNLLDEAWIPVRTTDGTDLASVRRALLESQNLPGLAFSTPTLTVAVLRQVLLPVVLDALGAPADHREWRARWRAGRLDPDGLEHYLDEHAHRFNLFDGIAPFAQVAGLRTARDEAKSASLLVPDIASGNNVPLFGCRTEGDVYAMPWQRAAPWLLNCQCWDTAAIKSGAVGDPQVRAGKTTGNPVGSVGRLGVAIPLGRSLFETLMLNISVVPDGLRGWEPGHEDLPQWRRAPAGPGWDARDARGLLDLLTWQSRRVRLLPSIDDNGEVCVASVLVAAGDRLLSVPEQEPHTLWAIEQKPGSAPAQRRPRRHRVGRAAWRGLEGLLAANEGPSRTSELLRQVGALRGEEALPEDFPLGVELTGVEYGNQSAVVEHVVHDAIPLPVAALQVDRDVGGRVTQIARDADELIKAIDLLEADLREARGGDQLPWDRGERASSRLVHRLDRRARHVLIELQRHPGRLPELVAGWQAAAREAAQRTADELLDSLPPSAFAGREVDDRPHRASLAEVRFRGRLERAVPRPAAPAALDVHEPEVAR